MRQLRRGMPGWWAIHAAAITAFFLLGMFVKL
jgi:hypothetical protein